MSGNEEDDKRWLAGVDNRRWREDGMIVLSGLWVKEWLRRAGRQASDWRRVM